MQISTSQLYDRSSTLMQQLAAKADKLQTQISTDKRINTASDDPVAFQKLALIKRASANDSAFGANIKVAQSLLAQSDSTLGSIESQLQKAAELAVQANSDALSPENRRVIGDQLTAIVQDLVGLANAKDVRGQPLFGGASGDTAVSQAQNGSVTFKDVGEPSPIPVGEGVDVHATDSAKRLFGNIPTANGASDVSAIISKFAAALTSNTGATDAASEAGADLRTALTQIGAARGSVGARAARLDLETARLTEVATIREGDRSSLEDTDTAAAILELQKTMTVLSATQASFSKLSSLSLFNYMN